MIRFLPFLSLLLIIFNWVGQLAAAAAFGLEPGPLRGPGWHGLYFHGQAAVLLAVWLLTGPLPYFRTEDRQSAAKSADKRLPPEFRQARRTHIYLILATGLTLLSSAWLLRLIHQNSMAMWLLGNHVIFVQWLLAALVAASASARALPAEAPDLGWFRFFALMLAGCGLALRVTLVLLPGGSAGTEAEEIMEAMHGPLQLSLLVGGFIWFILPWWLQRAAGRRAGPAFAAGLAMVLPLLLTIWFLLIGRAAYPGISPSLLRELQGFDQMMLDMLLTMFILAALLSLAALIRDRAELKKVGEQFSPDPAEPPEHHRRLDRFKNGVKPLRGLRGTVALVPAGAAVLAFFLALGYYHGQSPLRAVPYAGPLKTVRFAELEIKVPADFKAPWMNLGLEIDGQRFSFGEWVLESAEKADKHAGLNLGVKGKYDQEARSRILELEAGDDEDSRTRLEGYFQKNVLVDLGRDLSAEMGRPARLSAQFDFKRDQGPRLTLRLVVHYGDTGLARLEQERTLESAPTWDDPKLRADQTEAVEEFLARARLFFRNYQWLGPEANDAGPGFHTIFGRLAEAPENPFIIVNFTEREQGLYLWLRRESNLRRAEGLGMSSVPPATAGRIIRGYYNGNRRWSKPLTAAGRPGLIKIGYTAAPGPFLPGFLEKNSVWCEWITADQDNFPWKITFGDYGWTGSQLSNPELLGLGRAIINSFRYVGDGSPGASPNGLNSE